MSIENVYSTIQNKLDEMNKYSPTIKMVLIHTDDLCMIGAKYVGEEPTSDLTIIPANVMRLMSESPQVDKHLHGILDVVFKYFIERFGYALEKEVVDHLESQEYVESLKMFKETRL